MKEIIQLLNSENFYDGDIYIQIAKGKYELPKNLKGWIKKIKRKIR